MKIKSFVVLCIAMLGTHLNCLNKYKLFVKADNEKQKLDFIIVDYPTPPTYKEYLSMAEERDKVPFQLIVCERRLTTQIIIACGSHRSCALCKEVQG
jgi:hypothetical protein